MYSILLRTQEDIKESGTSSLGTECFVGMCLDSYL